MISNSKINRGAAAESNLSPIEQARAALDAIDVQPHVDRRDSLQASVERVETALTAARERLEQVRGQIRDHQQPDGKAIAHALLSGDDLPPPAAHLELERDQLLAGIAALNVQLRECEYQLRSPWNALRTEITEALRPVAEDLRAQAQSVVEKIEALYAATETLRRVANSGQIEGLRQMLGGMLVAGREGSRWVNFASRIPVDPELLVLRDLEPMRLVRAHAPDEVPFPSHSMLRL